MFSNDEQSDSKFQHNMHPITHEFNTRFNLKSNDVANKPKMNNNNNNSNNQNGSNNSSNNIKVPNNNKNNVANLVPFKKNWNCNDKVKEMVLGLDKIAQGCFANDENVQVECCKRLRKLLSIENNPPTDEVVATGVVPRLIQFLGNDNNPKLQFEAAWALTNVASTNTENTAVVIKNNGVLHFVNLMLSNDLDLAKQAVWALGNIAGDSSQFRDEILASGCLINLQKLQNRCFGVLNATALQNGWKFEQLLQDPDMLKLIEILRSVTWTLSNFCRGNPKPDIQYIKDVVSALSCMLTLPDTEILQDTAWAFSYLTDCDDGKQLQENSNNNNSNDNDNDNTMIERVDDRKLNAKVAVLMKESHVLKRLVDCLGHREYHVRHPALRALGNVVAGSDEQTQDVVNMGVCDKLLPLLDLKQYILCSRDKNGDRKLNRRGPLLKEACWMISNITAGTEEQIEKVVLSNIFPTLIDLLKKAPFEIRIEAAWAISNATSGGSKRQIKYLLFRGIVPPLVSLLESNDPKALLVAMEGLKNILKCGEEIKNERKEDENEFALVVEAAGGVDKLIDIQENEDMPGNVCGFAQKLVQDYWAREQV